MFNKLRDVEYKISLYTRLLLLYVVILVIMCAMSLFIIIQLVNLYKKWRRRQERFKQHTKLETSVSHASTFQNLKRSGDDNTDDELYNNINIEQEEKGYDFEQNLKTIADKYRDNLSKSCSKEEPDPDRAFIDKTYDNY